LLEWAVTLGWNTQLNELKEILQPKIDFYSRFVATDEVGVFAVAETVK